MRIFRRMNETRPRITLVVPVYNEDANLSVLHRELAQALAGLDWEVLFVDDGSIDASAAVLRDLADSDPRVHFLGFAENRGQSAAFAAGFAEARGEILITLDADLQNDPADIPRMLALYEQGWDMVIGRRARRRDPLVKRLSSRFANAVRNFLTNEDVTDTGCSLKVMRADMARRLAMFRGMHRFLPTLMKLEGARVTEIDVNHRPRLHGVSKYGTWDRAFSGLCDLLAVRWMQRRHLSWRVRERR